MGRALREFSLRWIRRGRPRAERLRPRISQTPTPWQPETVWHSFLKQPQLTLLGGGLPIIVNGQVVGGIGSSGGTIAQDTEIATAGLAAIQR